MAIPIVTLPQQGPIATRPRRESLFDTEGWDDGAAIAAKITIFRSSASFANTNLGSGSMVKVKGRDHNFDGAGGKLDKGQTLHWYSWTNKIRPTGANLQGAGVAAVFDVIRRIRESTWITFKFSSVPYISVPTWQVPQGVGLGRPHTTHNATTVMGAVSADNDRGCAYDVTLSGMPVEITQQETFSCDVESNGVQPTPTVDLYDTVSLRGVFLKGIQG